MSNVFFPFELHFGVILNAKIKKVGNPIGGFGEW